MSSSISKYFQNKLDFEESTNSRVATCNGSTSDDDFRSPIVIRQRNNLAWKINKTPKQKAKSKKGRCTKNSTIEIIKTNFTNDKENPEHLQMAIALSKSQYEAEYGQLSNEETPNIAEILQNAKSTSLERFGFKSDRSAIPIENRRLRSGTAEVPKRIKNRFKYITPTLTIRTAEDRESILVSKISLILQQPDLHPKEQVKSKLISSRLQNFLSEDYRIFNQDNIYNRECFYIDTLNLPVYNYKCGCLLKDWSSIPGRDISPERDKSCNLQTRMPENPPQHSALITSPQRSISPDLFGSDDEQQYYDHLLVNDINCNQQEDSDQNSSCSSLKRPSSFYSLDEFDEEPPNTISDNKIETQSDSVEAQNNDCLKDDDKAIVISSEDSLSEADECLGSPNKSPTPKRLFLGSNNSSEENCIGILDDALGQENSTPLNSNALIRSYNSAELNVTDYVNNLLNKESSLFEQPCDNDSEELPLSQSSIVVDEELNYSSHFATPTTSWRQQQPIQNTNSLDLITEEDPDINKPATTQPISTPNNYIIKTKNVTPMPNYDTMNTPLISKELQKLGVKPLKRARGVTLLKYIYESTHPLVGSEDVVEKSDSDDEGKIIKRRKKMSMVCTESASSIEIIGDRLLENEEPNDLIFETKQSTKIASCRVPLQIVWYNFVSSNPDIKENILLYEPLQLEFLHAMLKQLGFKFHIQDLLTFLDKKCITVRTAQKSKKRHR